MRVAATGDWHLANHRKFGGQLKSGVNNRARMILDAVRATVRIANREGCNWLLVAGDIFDTPRPEPQLIAALLAELAPFEPPTGEPGGLLLIPGNHDQVSLADGDDALGPLYWGNALAASECYITPRILSYPFIPADGLRQARLHPVGEDPVPLVALIHLGISDERTPPYLVGAADSMHVDEVRELFDGVRVVFAGNWHEHRIWHPRTHREPLVVQVGALVPTGFDNPGVHGYGVVSIWDEERPTEILHRYVVGPRFVRERAVDLSIARYSIIFGAAQKVPGGSVPVYASIEAEPGEVDAAREVAKAAMDAGVLSGFEIRLDRSASVAAARAASGAARAEETLDGALAAYVAEKVEPSQRQQVLELTRSYLARVEG